MFFSERDRKEVKELLAAAESLKEWMVDAFVKKLTHCLDKLCFHFEGLAYSIQGVERITGRDDNHRDILRKSLYRDRIDLADLEDAIGRLIPILRVVTQKFLPSKNFNETIEKYERQLRLEEPKPEPREPVLKSPNAWVRYVGK